MRGWVLKLKGHINMVNMINTILLLNILISYDLTVDIIRKVIIEWDICCKKPLEKIMNRCFSEMFNPTLLENGGTRWDHRTDFYHKGWKQKKRNGKYRWKKKRWEWWHENPSRWAPYYGLLPEKENYESIFMKSINYPRISRKMDELGNVKCMFSTFSYERDLAMRFITNKCMDGTGKRFCSPSDTAVARKDESMFGPGLEKYENMNTHELLSFIFKNLMD
jgi:hypothetical protein